MTCTRETTRDLKNIVLIQKAHSAKAELPNASFLIGYGQKVCNGIAMTLQMFKFETVCSVILTLTEIISRTD